jgi:hypothetical protein
MREHRVYLFTTAVAAVASIVLILSLLGLGADFSANVWPNAGGTSGEGPPISLPESPPAPAGRADVFSAPAGGGLPGAVGAPFATRGPVLVRVAPEGRRVLGTTGEPQRRPGRSDPKPEPTAPAAPAPAPAPPPPTAPVPAAEPVPVVAAAQDDDDDDEPQAAEVSDDVRKPKHGRKANAGQAKKVAPTPVQAPAQPPVAVGSDEEEDEDDGGDDDGARRGKERFDTGRGRRKGHD